MKNISAIRAFACGQNCTALLGGLCANNRDTVVLCHINSHHAGKGLGLKALDIFSFFGCRICHAAYDGDQAAIRQYAAYHDMSLDEARIYIEISIYQAMIKTQMILHQKGLILINKTNC